jgi:hypothetical protein
MAEEDFLAERIRALAARHRRLAEIHDALGEIQKAGHCRAVAHLEEERARRLELRGRKE